MGTIVVGVDGSEESRCALRWSTEEARVAGATLKAVHVWHYPPDYVWHVPPSAPVPDGALPDIPEREFFEKEARDLLDKTVTDAVDDDVGVAIEKEIVEGLVSDRLIDAARNAELLVVGSRGRGGVRGLLLGSVSQQCAHHAPCPLVIVREPARERGSTSNTIVAGVDGSATSLAALRWAFAEARRRGWRVLALHAWSLPSTHELAFAAAGAMSEMLDRQARALLHDAVTRTALPGVECTEIVEEGPPASLLADTARSAQLLVVGTRGRGGFSGLLLGSVSQSCAHHARCPTVIVPPKGR
jgi:nucleotide-binding universal stress UspA family protein